MAEELQSLLNRINEEGLKKAESERAEIIAAAEKKAKQIVSAANEEAAAIRANAQSDAEALRKRAEAAVKQASRDVLLELKNELERRLVAAVGGAAAAAFSPELMASIIKELATKFIADPIATSPCSPPSRIPRRSMPRCGER